MSRKAVSAVVICAALTSISAESALAQDEAFTPTTMYVGPALGLGGIGSAGLAFGGRFEKGIKKLAELGSGTLGIMLSLDYYSWSSSGSFSGGSWNSSVKYIPIGATANYHFVLENKKLDPFLGVGLGYQTVTTSCSGTSGGFAYDCGVASYSSGVYFIGRAGGQYRVNEQIGLYADVGAGSATVTVGGMVRVGN